MGSFIDITGNRYGKIVVISRAENLGRRPAWNCSCDCGKQKVVVGESLRSGKTTGCGCNRTHENLEGLIFSKLTVIKETYKYKPGGFKYYCLCECGNTTEVTGERLKSGHTKSCGCLKVKKIKEYSTKHGYCIGGPAPEYKIWCSMIQRCYSPKTERYSSYGGRGIRVCTRWKESFSNFIEDMGERPSKNHSIERVNVEKNYSPENCKWILLSEQGRNKRLSTKNKSGYAGVMWRERDKTYYVTIGVMGKRKWIGNFKNKEDAIKARKDAELKYWNKSS